MSDSAAVLSTRTNQFPRIHDTDPVLQHIDSIMEKYGYDTSLFAKRKSQARCHMAKDMWMVLARDRVFFEAIERPMADGTRCGPHAIARALGIKCHSTVYDGYIREWKRRGNRVTGEHLIKTMEALGVRYDAFERGNCRKYKRRGPCVAMREKVWFRLREQGYSYPEIAEATNAGSHTTVMAAVERMMQLPGIDKGLVESVNKAARKLNGRNHARPGTCNRSVPEKRSQAPAHSETDASTYGSARAVARRVWEPAPYREAGESEDQASVRSNDVQCVR